MTPGERAILRMQFRLRIHESDGQAYENLFVSIMNFSEPEFKSIKPNGQHGDRKNDGYINSKGVYFQVYAPEQPQMPSAKTIALAKAKTDFFGLKDFWTPIAPIKEYWFVFNDKFKSTNPDLELLISQIKSENGLSNAGVFCTQDLEDRLFALSEDQIISIVGFLPNLSTIKVDFNAVSSVIEKIICTPISHLVPSKLIAPDFDEKILFNNLSECVSDILTYASYQHGQLKEYFDNESSNLKRDVRDHLASLYTRFMEQENLEVPIGVTREDTVFFKMRYEMNPSPSSRTHDNAVILLLAYFFESCDVFKEPASVIA
jgi:hypothetical protein